MLRLLTVRVVTGGQLRRELEQADDSFRGEMLDVLRKYLTAASALVELQDQPRASAVVNDLLYQSGYLTPAELTVLDQLEPVAQWLLWEDEGVPGR